MVNIFRVSEMSCEHCVRAITNEVSGLPGIEKITISLGDKSVRVEHSDAVNTQAIVEAINEAGYEDVAVLA